MPQKYRVAILAVLAVVVIGILLFPTGEKGVSEVFSVTPNPATALEEVKGKGKPVVVEFYAVW